MQPKRIAVFSFLILFLFTTPLAIGVEESSKFLEGLRERGFNDIAIEYLEQMRTDPVCPEEFKKTLDYEVGKTLVADSLASRNMKDREVKLTAAKEAFEAFLKANPDHELSSSAEIELANVLIERGQARVLDAERSATAAEEKGKLFEEARGLYAEAKGSLEKAAEKYRSALREMLKGGIERTQPAVVRKREQLQQDLVQTELHLATVAYQTAKTYPADGEEFKTQMQAAADLYRGLFERYGHRLAALYARMWEGRCYKELKDKKKAIAILNEILVQPDEPPAFRQLKNKGLVLFLQTCLLPGAELADYKLAAEKAIAWEESAQGTEGQTEDGEAIKYHGGVAALEYARLLEKDHPDRAKALKIARNAFNAVSRGYGEYKQDAQQRLMDPLLRDPDAELAEPETFAEARDRAKGELDKMAAAQTMISMDLAEGKQENIQEYRDQMNEARIAATEYFRLALTLRDPETPLDEVNVVRYYLAYLHWLAEEPYHAAALGEFIARRYPSSPGGQQSAKITMAAYASIFNEAEDEAGRDFATDRMFDIADYITKRWPDGPEAEEAVVMLVRTAVAGGKIDQALAALPKIPETSPKRAETEALVGRSLWARYLQSLGAPEDERPPAEELAARLAKAKELLEGGIARLEQAGAAVDANYFTAMLSLAQIHLNNGDPAAAVAVLEKPEVGPLVLVEAGNPMAKEQDYDISTYKAALRAFVATEQLEKAEKVMNALESQVGAGGDAEAGKKLTQIYISLGRELQTTLEQLRAEGKEDQAKKVADGFNLFLTRISQRTEGNTFNSLYWVAETFMGMAAGYDNGEPGSSPQAKEYYQRAAETYAAMLAKIDADPNFAPSATSKTGLQVRLAKCLRAMGDFKEAQSLLVKILLKSNMMVDAQMEAAYTYQAWGTENPEAYMKAILGGQKAKKDNQTVNVIWGWGKIAKLVARSPKHSDIFHEARYNLALCRYKLAQTQSGSEKAETLKKAQTDILSTERLFPELGGPEWRAKYDGLLKQIQAGMGVDATGLPKRKQ